jgi:arsenate reductase
VDPRAIETLREIGYDARAHRSKGMGDVEGRTFDYVITVCDRANEECPIFPARVKRLHWSIEDPAKATGPPEEVMRLFRACRDDLRRRIAGLVEELARPGV